MNQLGKREPQSKRGKKKKKFKKPWLWKWNSGRGGVYSGVGPRQVGG